MTMRARTAALVLLGVAAGCAYYNGLYNANRLADDAARAEREGRPGEARSLWAQAAVKAESVATRYTGSRHRDDALLLWGKGLAQAGDCRRAVAPLAFAVDSSPDTRLRREARLLLADCRLTLRQPGQAIAAVEPLLSGADSADVYPALRLRGRAHLAADDYERAVDDLRRVPIEVGGLDLARAYTALGELDEAQRVLGLAAVGEYSENEWTSVLAELGERGPDQAAGVVDRLAARDDLTAGQRARLYLADGERWWRRGDLGRSLARYEGVDSVAADSTEGAQARAYLAVAAVRSLEDLQQLPDVQDRLRAATVGSGRAARTARPVLQAVETARKVVEDSAVPARDLKLFVVGEMFRDSLDAPRASVEIFLALAEQHPGSQFAPKALLAAALLDPARADSIGGMLERQYPYSPYTLALRGQAAAQFALLEDSLRTLLEVERQRLSIGVTPEAAEEELRRDRRQER
jgi:hypothetical protein